MGESFVSDEMVEAACIGMTEFVRKERPEEARQRSWNDWPEDDKEKCRKVARAAIEAALHTGGQSDG